MAQAIARFSIFSLGILIAATLVSIPYLKSLNVVKDKAEVRIRDQIIIADMAYTPQTRERGLGGRNGMNINEGMLFVFDEPGVYPFWMKDMKFPIDIIWINDQNEIIGITEAVDPQVGAPEAELASYNPPAPVKRALEVRSGRAKLLRATVGDSVRIRPLVQESN